jgi:hypothetical protein
VHKRREYSGKAIGKGIANMSEQLLNGLPVKDTNGLNGQYAPSELPEAKPSHPEFDPMPDVIKAFGKSL